MDKRVFTFFLLAMAILFVNSLVLRRFFPQPQPAKPVEQAQAPEGDKPEAGADGDKPPEVGAAQPGAEDKPGEQPAVPPVVVEEKPATATWATLGSLDPAGPYRMLVTLSSRGAAVERAELNNPRYHNVDNVHPLGGYLGYLAPTDAPNAAGVVVNVVGPGTPAAGAGLKVGDVITAVNEQPVAGVLEYDALMRATDPEDAVKLGVKRDGADLVVEVPLRSQPLAVVHREAPDRKQPDVRDPASFLLTLDRVGEKSIDVDTLELPGVNLRDADWELLPANGNALDTVSFRRVVASHDVEVVKHYTLLKEDPNAAEPLAQPYTLVLRVEVKNLAEEKRSLAYRLDGPTGLPMEGEWYARSSKSGEGLSSYGMRDVVHGYLEDGFVTRGTQRCQAIAAGEVEPIIDKLIKYVGVDSQYFAAVVMPQHADPPTAWFSRIKPITAGPVPEGRPYLTDVTFRMVRRSVEAEPQATAFDDEFKIYLGPKAPEKLAEYGLDPLVYYGWFDWVAKPMLVVLHFLYGIFGNYGIAIMLLTVLVRSCMFPLSRKQALNAMKMQELQPEIKKLAERYKNSPEQRMKAQQELFRKHNYNPFSGCLPIFIQLPIFVGLYRSLAVDVELRQAPLISDNIRWASNLAAPDMFWYWEPYLPQFLAGEDGFLGPFLNLLPLVTIVLFLVQQKMFMPPPTDEQSAMQQKMMKYMMIFMGFMFFKVPAGLCVYFITSSLWGIAERKLLPKAKPKDAPMAEAVLNVESRPKSAEKKSKRR